MSNTPKKASCQNVIVYLNDRPHYELTADEIVFPIEFKHRGVNRLGYFAADAQVQESELKACLAAAMPGWVETAAARRLREDRPIEKTTARTFSLKHFRRVYAATGSERAQRDWFERNPGLQWKLYDEGYNQVLPDIQLESELTELDFEAEFENAARLKRILYSPETERVEEIPTHHVFDVFSQKDVRVYDQASRITRDDRGGGLRVNWDVLRVQLYDPLINRIEGMVVKGEPCEKSNKPDWIKLVPFLDKMSALLSVFREDAEKNVQ